MEDLSRIEQLEKSLEEVDYFIDSPTSYIYDHIEDPTQYEIIECMRAITYSNRATLDHMRSGIEKLRETINVKTVSSINSKVESPSINIEQSELSAQTGKDLSEYIKLILYSDMGEEVLKKLSSLSREDKINLKLYFLKMINRIKSEIKTSILKNPVSSISKLQSDLSTYEIAMSFIDDIEREEELEVGEEDIPSHIIFVPNNHNSTYLFDDISDYHESKKEIKNIIDKIVNGYFLKTKDTKSIEDSKTNSLFEYKHPNGIRVLYVVHKGLIFICSLFYKDKQKSIRIDGYYKEAIRRFNSSKDYIIENCNNPDFFIEQDELLGQIYSLIDDVTLSKKAGE